MEEVGVITVEEKLELYDLQMRLEGLMACLNGLSDPNAQEVLYNKIVSDAAVTKNRIQQWFDQKGSKYAWPKKAGASFYVEFASNQVFLVEEDPNKPHECRCAEKA